MQTITERSLMYNDTLKKRFAKDHNLSINVLETKYFLERLKLFGCYDKFVEYIRIIADQFKNDPQAYLEYYNSIKDAAINAIKNSEAYQDLNSTDMNKFAKTHNISTRELYKEPNIGHRFISIDMRKANFTALVHYGKTYGRSFFDSYEYDKFINQFTSYDHIIKSKYIRQVIFGNCNPKRQITYESYMMDQLITVMLQENLINENQIHALLSDEILILADNLPSKKIETIRKFCSTWTKEQFPIQFEFFMLNKIDGCQAFIKQFDNKKIELKCVNPDEAPFIYRFIKHESVHENDLIFSHDGKLAKFLETPELSLRIS